MAYTLKMPEVGETVTEGTIEKWLKQPGEKIEKYEPIVEINTDKVNVELPSPVTGTVLGIVAKEGETVLIGAALCTIDEVASETPADTAPPRPTEEAAAAEPALVAAEPALAQPKATAKRPQPAVALANGHDGAGEHRVTPRVRKVAAELGVDLAQVQGSGPRGRVVEEDVRAFAAKGLTTAVAERPTQPRPAAASTADEETVPLTGIRRTIAQRMTASDAVPLAAHAVVQSLLDHPYLNASWGEDKIVLKKRVHLGIAVASERGLIVPVVRARWRRRCRDARAS